MISDKVHRYLVAYDVSSDSRRTRLAKALESYGDRIQYSVFIIDTKPAKLVRLRAVISDCLDFLTDSTLICDLGPLTTSVDARIQSVGCQRTIPSPGSFVL